MSTAYKIFLFFMAFIPATAQSFLVKTYSEGDGLTLGSVGSMAQDGEGRIWFSCRTGILVFDGKDWTQLFGAKKPSTRIEHIRADRFGNIWGSTKSVDKPVMKFTEKGWEALPKIPDDIPFPEAPMQLKIGSSLYPFEMASFQGKSVPVISPTKSTVLFFLDGKWQYFGSESGLERNSVLAMDAFGDSVYLAGKKGLFKLTEAGLDDSLNKLMPKEYVSQVLSVAAEGSGRILQRLWVLGKGWLGYIENNTFKKLVDIPLFATAFFSSSTAMLPDGTGGLLFGYSMRFYHTRIDEPIVRSYGTHSGLGADGVLALLEDRERHYWVSGLHGVSKISSMRFANFDRRHGLPSDEVTCVSQWGPGEVLFAQENGFCIFDGVKARPLDYKVGTEMFRPFHMHKGPDGSFWVAAMNDGLLRITKDERVISVLAMDEPLRRYVNDVLPRDNAPTLVSTGAGLRVLDGNYLKRTNSPLDKINTRRIIQLRDGSLAVGTRRHGLWLQVNGTWQQFLAPNPEANSITSLMEDSQGRFFIGTFGGLYTFNQQEGWQPFEALDNTRTIYFTTEDQHGQIWAGVDNGVFVVNDQGVRHLTKKDGLGGVETNRGGGLVDDRGFLWIPTDRGVSRYQEMYDFPVASPSALKITQIESGGQLYNPAEPVKLEAERKDLVIHFQVISFVQEDSLTFQSWLEGYDKGWLEEYKSASRSYRYTNLPPGTYRFHVRVRGEAGDWSPVVSSGPIEIPKPFWAQIWFIGLVLFLVLGISYSIFDYLSSKRYSRYLEKQVVDRTTDLSNKTVELEKQIAAARKAEAEIQALNEELEARVLERTTALESAQRDLVENAHYAGMAEIANSIIHNVGNILNSVSTSGYLIKQTVDESKMAAILRANDLLLDNMENLEDFLLTDPRGKQLLMFYISLGEVFQKERDRLTKHASLLMEKIDSIKDVVAQQHNYASGVYQNEELDPRELIDTSIKIMETTLDNQGIKLTKDYRGTAFALIQRTKFIHILVNLLKNAKESILSEGSDERRIAISIQEEKDHLFIRVRDTGLGIPAEHLQKIFNHGFTTKEDGHGFGLHSSANAIQEMGGSMWAESPGVGQGATFVLRLNIVHKPAKVA